MGHYCAWLPSCKFRVLFIGPQQFTRQAFILRRSSTKTNLTNFHQTASWSCAPSYRFEMLFLNSQLRKCIPVANKRVRTCKHDIESHSNQGAKLTWVVVAFAKIMKEATLPSQVMFKHNLWFFFFFNSFFRWMRIYSSKKKKTKYKILFPKHFFVHLDEWELFIINKDSSNRQQ